MADDPLIPAGDQAAALASLAEINDIFEATVAANPTFYPPDVLARQRQAYQTACLKTAGRLPTPPPPADIVKVEVSQEYTTDLQPGQWRQIDEQLARLAPLSPDERSRIDPDTGNAVDRSAAEINALQQSKIERMDKTRRDESADKIIVDIGRTIYLRSAPFDPTLSAQANEAEFRKLGLPVYNKLAAAARQMGKAKGMSQGLIDACLADRYALETMASVGTRLAARDADRRLK
jgi:hypothetical protein